MKKTVLMILLLSMTLYANLSVAQIEAMIGKIHNERKGVNLETLDQTKEPFVRVEEENNVTVVVMPKATEPKMALHAIMNGRAYINESWVRPDEMVMGYTLKHVGKRGVVLRNGNHIKKLFLHKNENDIIKIEGR